MCSSCYTLPKNNLPHSTRDKREIVYNRARGCNLYNTALGTYLFKHYGGKSILDCTAGWGDRLIAAYAADANFYRGWDTNPALQPVYNQIGRTIQDLGYNMDWKIELGSFESARQRFLPSGDLHNRFTGVILAPPFFDKELYQGDDTSTSLYPTINTWYTKFYEPMIASAVNALQPGGHIVAYITQGRMFNTMNQKLKNAGMTYLGIVGFQQEVSGHPGGMIRDTFVWRKQPPPFFTCFQTCKNKMVIN